MTATAVARLRVTVMPQDERIRSSRSRRYVRIMFFIVVASTWIQSWRIKACVSVPAAAWEVWRAVGVWIGLWRHATRVERIKYRRGDVDDVASIDSRCHPPTKCGHVISVRGSSRVAEAIARAVAGVHLGPRDCHRADIGQAPGRKLALRRRPKHRVDKLRPFDQPVCLARRG